jgi:hypothetical protein
MPTAGDPYTQSTYYKTGEDIRQIMKSPVNGAHAKKQGDKRRGNYQLPDILAHPPGHYKGYGTVGRRHSGAVMASEIDNIFSQRSEKRSHYRQIIYIIQVEPGSGNGIEYKKNIADIKGDGAGENHLFQRIPFFQCNKQGDGRRQEQVISEIAEIHKLVQPHVYIFLSGESGIDTKDKQFEIMHHPVERFVENQEDLGTNSLVKENK